MTNVSTQIPPQSRHDKIMFSSVPAIDSLKCLHYSSAVQSVNCNYFLVTVGFSRRRAGRYCGALGGVASDGFKLFACMDMHSNLIRLSISTTPIKIKNDIFGQR
jgi:hypothetical protein